MTYGQFIRGLTRAYEHKGGIKTLALGKLDQAWFADIQREAAAIINSADSSDVTDTKHVTHWTRPTGIVRQFSLFNSNGRSGDYTDDFGGIHDRDKKRLVFPEMKAIARFADIFQGSLRNLRLNGMGTSSKLSAHEENSISFTKWGRRYIVRFHLPLFTHRRCWMYLDDEKFHYDEGTLYFFNHGCVHAASNEGTDPRYHFVLDCFLTEDLFDRVIGERDTIPGFVHFVGAQCEVPGYPHHFPNFIRENGKVVEGGIDYGRKVPSRLAYWQKNYPSVFGAPP